ncbi:MAG: stage II sporulation protein P [Ruminococcaceae bacterium]|nr:stage II sporulation protein P [Oscillospiraceae bacterium]
MVVNMKGWTQKAAGFGSIVLVMIAVLCVANRIPQVVTQNTALAAAGFIMPGGAAEAFESDFLEEEEEDDGTGSQAFSSVPQEMSSMPASSVPESSSQVSSQASSETSSTPASSVPSSSLGAKIQEISIANSGVQYQNIWVRNSNKNHGIDIASELAKAPAVKIKKNSTPQVLIYHTHTTEAFLGDTRSQDLSRSVVAVGDQIEAQLKAAGINVVHDKTVHDYPTYNGSYDRSKVTMQKNLKQYPGIQVTLDIHRDAMAASNGTRIKPTAVINGKKAAQVMIISGCDDDGTYGFPNWEYNLRLAVRLQQSVATMYPGLARPLNFCPRKYNENLTKGSLLVEIGTEVNTLDEAKYTGELFGKALVDTLNKLT